MQIVGGKLWGMMGLLWAMVVSSFLFYCVYAVLASKQTGTSVWEQLKYILKHTIFSLIAYVGAYFLLCRIDYSDIFMIIIGILSFSVIYIASAFLSHSEVLKYLIAVIKK